MGIETKFLGTDYDPNNDLTHEVLPDGDVKTTCKGEKIRYMEYIDELEERTTRRLEGKPIIKSSVGYFSGYGKGTLKSRKN